MAGTPTEEFNSWHYLRHNQRRQEHLASLELPIAGRTVLEVAAGIGDHTSFFLDRGCEVTSTEGRAENLEILRRRYPGLRIFQLDLDDPDERLEWSADVVYCYGILYHLRHPAEAIAYLAQRTRALLLLETCVSPGSEVALNPVPEDGANPTQALHGSGCRPTRPWVWAELSRHFKYVYATTTQPWHEEFPLEWNFELAGDRLARSVFVASRTKMRNRNLSSKLLPVQRRH